MHMKRETRMNTAGPLEGVTVLAAGRDHAAALLGRLLADLSAQTVPIGLPPETGGRYDQWLHAHAAQPVDWDDARTALHRADVLVCDRRSAEHFTRAGLGPSELATAYPELITVQISPYGLTGPLRDVPATELTLQSQAGLTAATGEDGQPTVTTTVPLAACTAALSGLITITAGLIGRNRGGGGDYFDIAEFDGLLTHVGTLLPRVALSGEPPHRVGNRHGMAAPWNSYPCRDRHIVVCTMGEAMWRRLAASIGRTDLIGDPRFADTTARVTHTDDLDTLIAAWTADRDADDAVAALRAAGVPSARISSPDEVSSDPKALRRSLIDSRTGDPRSPLRSLVPTVHPDQTRRGHLWDPIPRGSPPLHGIRLLELCAYTAGPQAGRLLAQLGADVLKVEPPGGDGSRHLAQRIGSVGYLYFVNNAGKRSCRLDLADPGHRAELDTLIGSADILLTSLASDTLTANGLSPGQILARHRLVHCAVTGHGLDSADRSVDTVIQAESGMMHLVGRSAGNPLRTPVSSADVLGAYLAAAAALLAAYIRQITGFAASADVALFDAAVWAAQAASSAAEANRAPQLIDADDGRILIDAAGLPAETGGPTAALLKAAAAMGLPAAPLHDLAQAVRHPQVRARQMIITHTWADTDVLITGNHLRSRLRGAPPPAPAPVPSGDPVWPARPTTERPR